MRIQILGTGCPKCKKLAGLAEEAAKELALDYELEKITDINDIVSFGVMSTPALAVDGKVLVSGKVLSAQDVIQLLEEAMK
jgi:small redox-active disulfide protein 2